MQTSASGEPAPRTGRSVHIPLARYWDELPIFRDRIYFNTCSLGDDVSWEALADRPGYLRLSPFFCKVQEDYVRALERLAATLAH